jgi:hypothetical protein
LGGAPVKARAVTAPTTPPLAGQTLASLAEAAQRVGAPVAQGVLDVVEEVAPATEGVQSGVNGVVEPVAGVVQGLTAPPGAPAGPNAKLSLP